MEIVLKPIGIVHTKLSDEEVKNSWEGVEGVVEVFREYVKGLKGIEDFSHIIILAYLHKTTEKQKKVLKVRHRRLLRFGIKIEDIPEVGVFCTDSPHRPNPIALTIVELVKRDGRFLHVRGLDLFDGTPVLDIKPYTPDRVVEKINVPQWYKVLEQRIFEKFGKKLPV
ncbi:MAG: tRNA (N6-threonylcarbamoyladenosine(37)-N6)-methyltransferase TrmO [Thermoprotei archaeon]|nr:MAG: tRNA (N6-threonylcarbamoyladenosine(37)-N6)-methyltransferase TrmO [Thermoprotei archaeon]